MKIQILGMGCRKCVQLYENVLQALQRAEMSAEVVKVKDLPEITAMGVFLTPALAIDGQVVFTGRVADVEELAHIFSQWAATS